MIVEQIFYIIGMLHYGILFMTNLNSGKSEVDTRNVIDYYKYWKDEAIKANLDEKRNNFGILCANIHGDFNIGSIIRNANAFLAKEVIIFGRKKYDRRGTVGTHNYTSFRHVKEVEELPNIPIIAVDNTPGASNVLTYVFPTTYFLLAFGEESVGLPSSILDIAVDSIYIPQYGSVRSLNVGVASGIMMHEICRRLK